MFIAIPCCPKPESCLASISSVNSILWALKNHNSIYIWKEYYPNTRTATAVYILERIWSCFFGLLESKIFVNTSCLQQIYLTFLVINHVIMAQMPCQEFGSVFCHKTTLKQVKSEQKINQICFYTFSKYIYTIPICLI